MEEYKCNRSSTGHGHEHGHEHEHHGGVSLSRAISPRKRESTSMASEYLVLTEIASNMSTYVQNIKVSSRSASTSTSTSTSIPKSSSRQVVTPSRPRPSSGSSSSSSSNTIKDDAKLLLNLREIALSPREVSEGESETAMAMAMDSPRTPKRAASTSTSTMAFENTISPSLSFEARRHSHYESQSQSKSCISKGFYNSASAKGSYIRAEYDDINKNSNNSNSHQQQQQQCDSDTSTTTSTSTDNTFSLSCPSLSLKDDDNFRHNNNYIRTNTSNSNNTFTNSNTVPLETNKPPTSASVSARGPPELFSRPIRKRSSLDVSDVAETLASNVMQSFITALEWRTKVWMRDLARTLSSKFKAEAAKLQLEKQNQEQEQDNQGQGPDAQGKAKGSKKKGSKQSTRSSTSTKSRSSPRPSSPSSSLDKLREKFKKSQEARVIEALSQSSSSIIVHDVRTTFFVLEQQLNTAPIDHTTSTDGEEKKDDDYIDTCSSHSIRPLKKRRTVTNESVAGGLGVEVEVGPPATATAPVPSPTTYTYTLSHALNLDSRCSVSTSSEEKISVSLQTPGVIDGTFVRNEDGDVFLVDVSIALDTECLALSMEQKSRLVVRTAAEECIICPRPRPTPALPSANVNVNVNLNASAAKSIASSGGNSRAVSSDEGLHPRRRGLYTQQYSNLTPNPNTSVNTSTNSPFTPQGQSSHTTTFGTVFGNSNNALVTPNVNDRDGSTSDDSEGMPPPPPRLPFGESGSTRSLDIRTSFLNPRRVSPTCTAGSNSNAAMNANASAMSMPSNDIVKSPTPSKVAVTILAPASSGKAPAPPLVSPHATFKEEGKGSIFLSGDGPLLPALLEAASAVHTMCN